MVQNEAYSAGADAHCWSTSHSTRLCQVSGEVLAWLVRDRPPRMSGKSSGFAGRAAALRAKPAGERSGPAGIGERMPRLPRITAVELLRALRRDGWIEAKQVGSHLHLKHPTKPGRVTVPRHAGEVLAPKLLTSILAQADLTADELRDLL